MDIIDTTILKSRLNKKALPKPARSSRTCLKCNQSFMSTGAGNRICDKCRAQSAFTSAIRTCRDRPAGMGGPHGR